MNNTNLLPIGFSMQLTQNTTALDNYSNLSKEEKDKITNYITSSDTGEEVKDKIKNVILNLENDTLDTLL